MMFCDALFLLLYPSFPKEVNIVFSDKRARRFTVKNIASLKKLVLRYNGLANIFVRIYDSKTVNKIVFDIDSDNLYEAFLSAKEFAEKLVKDNILFIPVFTGKKGFHFYILTEPWTMPNEETARVLVRDAQIYFIKHYGIKYVDWRLVGSVTHWIRVPNTLRKNGRWCTFLPQEFFTWSYDKFLEITRYPSCYSLDSYRGNPIDLTKFVNIIDSVDYYIRADDLDFTAPINIKFSGEKQVIFQLLSEIVRPCILYGAFDPEADHWIRTYFVSELMWDGFTKEEIHDIIKKIGWNDYDPKITEYHINKIFEKKLMPPTCRKLQSMGYCLGKKCPYFPAMNYWWIELVMRGK